MRSEAMVLMSLANRQHLTVEETLQKAHELGFDCDNNPEIKQFIIQYIESK